MSKRSKPLLLRRSSSTGNLPDHFGRKSLKPGRRLSQFSSVSRDYIGYGNSPPNYTLTNSQDKVSTRLDIIRDTLPIICLLTFTFLFQSMPTSYLPVILKRDYDIPESTSALIISASTFTYIISCIVSPKLDDLMDPNLLLILSYCLFLISGISFSFILSFERAWIPGLAITIRAILGFSAGVFENIASTVLVRKFSHHIGTLSAVIESSVNVGYLSGPILGGILYSWTNRFSTTSLIPLCISAAIYIMFAYQASSELKNKRRQNRSNSSNSELGSNDSGGGGSFRKLLGTWQMVLFLFYPFYSSFVLNLPGSITAPYVYETFDKGAVYTGLLFLVDSISYMIFAVMAGVLTDTDKPGYTAMGLWFFALTPFLMAAGSLMIGPAFFFNVSPSYYWIAAGFCISSCAVGLGCGPLLNSLLTIWAALHRDNGDDYSAYITSFYLVTFSLGEGAGNAVGGALYAQLGYNKIITIFGLSCIVMGLINTYFVVSTWNKPYMRAIRKGGNGTAIGSISEIQPLLDSDKSDTTTPHSSEINIYSEGRRTEN